MQKVTGWNENVRWAESACFSFHFERKKWKSESVQADKCPAIINASLRTLVHDVYRIPEMWQAVR